MLSMQARLRCRIRRSARASSETHVALCIRLPIPSERDDKNRLIEFSMSLPASRRWTKNIAILSLSLIPSSGLSDEREPSRASMADLAFHPLAAQNSFYLLPPSRGRGAFAKIRTHRRAFILAGSVASGRKGTLPPAHLPLPYLIARS